MCAVWPMFFQVILPPAWIVTAAGLKSKSSMSTVSARGAVLLPPPLAAGVGAPPLDSAVTVSVVVLSLPPPHAGESEADHRRPAEAHLCSASCHAKCRS